MTEILRYQSGGFYACAICTIHKAKPPLNKVPQFDKNHLVSSSVAENDHFCTVIWPESKMLSNRALRKAKKAFFVTNLSKCRIEAESKV